MIVAQSNECANDSLDSELNGGLVIFEYITAAVLLTFVNIW
jgi:hypothetical protein